jgi:DtxR family Mn-dependent transcriptional regulator
MIEKRDLDECLECLWHMKEEGTVLVSVLRQKLGEEFDGNLLNILRADGLIELSDAGEKVELTKAGSSAAQLFIRSHRLAETLMHTVLGDISEPLACEFEHMVIPEIVDSICTLLAHPRECPHGKPIPEGECCKHASVNSESLLIPLTQMKIKQLTRVAYIHYKDEQQYHKIESLHISSGTIIKLLQKSPAYVVECEDSNIVFDDEIAAQIFVWKHFSPTGALISTEAQ